MFSKAHKMNILSLSSVSRKAQLEFGKLSHARNLNFITWLDSSLTSEAMRH